MDQHSTTEGTRDRRIALLKPLREQDGKSNHAMQLFSSMLWAFKGTTRSSWETASANDADVVVFHAEDGRDADISQWQASGKLAVLITTDLMSGPATRHALVYPFRAAQVLELLEHLDTELRLVEQKRAAGTAVSQRLSPDSCWAFSEALREIRGAAAAEGTWSAATRNSQPVIWIRGRGDAYFAESHHVAAIRDGSMSYRGLTLRRAAAPPEGAVMRPGVELSWFSAYHADGELIEGLSASARHRIVRWPDFGSIRPPTAHLRALAVLATQQMDLKDLAVRAGITADEATRTLNALLVHGLLTSSESPTARAASASDSPSPSAGALSGLLAKIRRRLRLGR